jgi:transposase InsO family protein
MNNGIRAKETAAKGSRQGQRLVAGAPADRRFKSPRSSPRKNWRARVPGSAATRPTEKWSMDFVAARPLDGRWFRVLTVIDQFTRECLGPVADRA